MNFSFFNNDTCGLQYIIKELEEDGHYVLRNQFSKDADVLITESYMYMYPIYRNIKKIKQHNIKLINIVVDIPLWLLAPDAYNNTLYKNILQYLYHFSHKKPFLFRKLHQDKPDPQRVNSSKAFSKRFQSYFNYHYGNRMYYQRNYREFIKKSDLILSITKFSQKIFKKLLKIDTEVCYQCVDSDYLLNLPKEEIKYDAINISRIVPHKNQETFLKAANRLGLNILVLGNHQDKNIKLDCPHYYLKDHYNVMKILNQSKFYVDPSLFEGFGMTPVEAAFLDKNTIASDTYVHREILGDYALYFESYNVDDLVNKMKIIMEGDYPLKNEEIKKKFSTQALKKRILKHVDSLF